MFDLGIREKKIDKGADKWRMEKKTGKSRIL
jgi:hypothetical protein